MRIFMLAATAFGYLCTSAVAAAQNQDSPETLQQQIAGHVNGPIVRWCEAQPLALELSRQKIGDDDAKAQHLYISTMCALSRRNINAANKHADALFRMGRDDNFIAVGLAMQSERKNDLFEYLQFLLIDSSRPLTSDVAAQAVPGVMNYLYTNGYAKEVDQLVLDSIRSGRLNTIGSEVANGLAYRTLQLAVVDNTDLVPDLLKHLTHPNTYVTLLGSRQYQAIWPLMEQRVGPNFTNVRADDVASAKSQMSAVDRNGGDQGRTASLLAHSLYWDRQYGEVIRMGEAASQQFHSSGTLTEDMAWIINLAAFSYFRSGDKARAEELMDQIGLIDPRQYSWAISFAINRVLLITGEGRWDDVLDATEVAERAAEVGSTPYAQLLIAFARTCALVQLGRSAEAENDISFILDKGRRFAEPAAGAMICAGRLDDARKIVIESLENESSRRMTIDLLQPQELQFLNIRTALPNLHDHFSNDADVKAVFLQYAREVPEAFYPAPATMDTQG